MSAVALFAVGFVLSALGTLYLLRSRSRPLRRTTWLVPEQFPTWAAVEEARRVGMIRGGDVVSVRQDVTLSNITVPFLGRGALPIHVVARGSTRPLSPAEHLSGVAVRTEGQL